MDTTCLMLASFVNKTPAGHSFFDLLSAHDNPNLLNLWLQEKNIALPKLQFSVKGKFDALHEGPNKLSLSEGKYTLSYSPDPDDRTYAGSSDEILFSIHLPIAYLNSLAIPLQPLSAFLQKVQQNIACRLTDRPLALDPEMLSLTRNILDCPYSGDIKNIYLEAQISNLLTMALNQAAASRIKRKEPASLRPQDIIAIQATREYLFQHMDEPLTLVELAHKMGLNDFKLKKGYKQLYGTTLYEDFFHYRMQKARQWLTETELSIFDIAELTGYKNVSAFSVAFKKYYGNNPGALRRSIRA